MGIIATKTYDKTTQIIDKDNILIITEWEFYDNVDCIDNGTDKHKVNSFIENSTYYLLVYGQNLLQWNDITYSSPLTVHLQNGYYGVCTCVFKEFVSDSSTYIKAKYTLTFDEFTQPDYFNTIEIHLSDSYGTDKLFTLGVNKNIKDYLVKNNKIYFNGNDSHLNDTIIDSDGNYVAVGYSSPSGGSGTSNALIVKFDSDLNVLASKTYSGSFSDLFLNIVYDPAGYYVVVGNTSSEGSGASDALIVKFDINLNKIAAKIYGGSSFDQFLSIAYDPTGYYVVVGNTSSEGKGNFDALIIKFNTDLTINNKKVYGKNNYDYFNSVIVDGLNYIAVGYTNSDGQGDYDGLIVKFDSNLNILVSKLYGSIANDRFYSIVIDPNDGNYIAVGYTASSEGQGNDDALIVKFSSNLNSIISSKLYGDIGNDYFYSIAIDPNDGNYIAVGYTDSEGQGYYDGLVVKFDSNLNITFKKICGGTDYDYFYSIAIDPNDGGYIVAGYIYLDIDVRDDTSIIKFFKLLSGSFVSANDPLYLFSDSNLFLTDITTSPNVTLLNPGGFSSKDSNLTLQDSSLTLSIPSYTEDINKILN